MSHLTRKWTFVLCSSWSFNWACAGIQGGHIFNSLSAASTTSMYMSHITRKPVFGVCDKVRLKLACTATETSYGLEISAIASRGIILSKQRTTKVLIRLRGCAGWSAPLLFAYGINRFSHDVALIWANIEGSDKTESMPRLTWAFASCLNDKYPTLFAIPSVTFGGIKVKSTHFSTFIQYLLN